MSRQHRFNSHGLWEERELSNRLENVLAVVPKEGDWSGDWFGNCWGRRMTIAAAEAISIAKLLGS